LQQVYGEDSVGRTQVFDWFCRFKEGKISIESDTRSGRPSTSKNEEMFDSKFIVHHEYVSDGQKINKECYLEVLRRLRECVRRKRREKWRDDDWILHHDNAPAHNSHFVQQFLAKHGIAQLGTHQISYRVFFPILKAYESSEMTPIWGNGGHQTKSTKTVLDIPKEEFAKCFQQWQQRWAKCIAAEGNYVEDN